MISFVSATPARVYECEVGYRGAMRAFVAGKIDLKYLRGYLFRAPEATGRLHERLIFVGFCEFRGVPFPPSKGGGH